MNREQAAEKLQQGYQLKHIHFLDGEFIQLKKNEIQTEDGYNFSEQFWKSQQFSDGWEIVNFQDEIPNLNFG